MNPAGPGRDRTIDVARGLGILLVVFGHNWWVLEHSAALYRVVYSFHVPLFFFLSGLFLKPDQGWSALVAARARSLLQPYAVTLLFGLLLAAATHTLRLGPYLWGAAYASGPTIANPWQALWFLPHLFLALAVAQGLIGVAGESLRRPAVALPLIAGLLVLGLAVLPLAWQEPMPARLGHMLGGPAHSEAPGLPGLPWSADVLGVSLAFVLAGWVAAPRVRRLVFRPAWLIACTLAFAALHAVDPVTMDLSLRHYTQPLAVTAMAALGIEITLQVSAALARRPRLGAALAYIGTGSLFVLMFHVLFQARLTGFVRSHAPAWVPLAAIGAWGFGVAAPLLIWEGVRRTPWLARLYHQRGASPARA